MDALGAGAGSNDLEVPDVGEGSVRAEDPTANSFFWANPPVAAGEGFPPPKTPGCHVVPDEGPGFDPGRLPVALPYGDTGPPFDVLDKKPHREEGVTFGGAPTPRRSAVDTGDTTGLLGDKAPAFEESTGDPVEP